MGVFHKFFQIILVGTYTLREAGVRIMRILESLDIQLRPSSSERIGNIGEVLVA